MKRKFLSIAICLMVCFSSMFMFSGCKEDKSVPVAEAVAMESLNTAMSKMENETAVKLSCSMMGAGEAIIISSQNKMYANIPGTSESWMTKNGDVFDVYTIENVSETEIPEYEYIKSIMPAIEETSDETLEDSLSGLFGDMGEMFEGMEFNFSSASELKGVLTVNFALENEGEVVYNIAFTIQNEILTSITMKMFGFAITFNIQYGEQYLQEIPEIPLHNWYVCKPYIEVEFQGTSITEPIELTVGDQVNLDDFSLYFYEDESSWSYQEFNITSDMLNVVFDTTTATEVDQPRIITITFCGLTYDIQYTVNEPSV